MSSPIFILGYMHSGTSVLQKILGSHSNIFDPRLEVKLFDYLDNFEHFVNSNQLQEENLTNIIDLIIENGYQRGIEKFKQKNEYVSGSKNYPFQIPKSKIIKIFFDRFTDRSGSKTYFLDKTNMVLLHLEEVLKLNPKSKFIFLFRDPRDVLASKKKRMQTTNSQRYPDSEKLKKKKFEKRYSLPLDAISLISFYKAYRRMSCKIPPNNIIFLTYERLTYVPEETSKELCTFLDIDFSHDMLDFQFHNSADRNLPKAKGVFTNSGKYRQVLTASEIAFIDRLFWSIYSELEYKEDTTIKLGNKISSIFFYPRLFTGLIDRLYSRWKLLNFSLFLEYLNQRIKLLLFR